MFKPEHKSHFYLLLVATVAMLIGYSAFKHYKPYLIKTSCSEIAARSVSYNFNEKVLQDPKDEYNEFIKKCIEDSGLH
jgi:hypothetical protein